MICKNCGTSFNEKDVFCPNCGMKGATFSETETKIERESYRMGAAAIVTCATFPPAGIICGALAKRKKAKFNKIAGKISMIISIVSTCLLAILIPLLISSINLVKKDSREIKAKAKASSFIKNADYNWKSNSNDYYKTGTIKYYDENIDMSYNVDYISISDYCFHYDYDNPFTLENNAYVDDFDNVVFFHEIGSYSVSMGIIENNELKDLYQYDNVVFDVDGVKLVYKGRYSGFITYEEKK